MVIAVRVILIIMIFLDSLFIKFLVVVVGLIMFWFLFGVFVFFVGAVRYSLKKNKKSSFDIEVVRVLNVLIFDVFIIIYFLFNFWFVVILIF